MFTASADFYRQLQTDFPSEFTTVSQASRSPVANVNAAATAKLARYQDYAKKMEKHAASFVKDTEASSLLSADENYEQTLKQELATAHDIPSKIKAISRNAAKLAEDKFINLIRNDGVDTQAVGRMQIGFRNIIAIYSGAIMAGLTNLKIPTLNFSKLNESAKALLKDFSKLKLELTLLILNTFGIETINDDCCHDFSKDSTFIQSPDNNKVEFTPALATATKALHDKRETEHPGGAYLRFSYPGRLDRAVPVHFHNNDPVVNCPAVKVPVKPKFSDTHNLLDYSIDWFFKLFEQYLQPSLIT